MTRNEMQLTGLPFYTDTEYQDKNKWWVQNIYKNPSPNSRFLPFQIIKDITEVGGTTCPVPSSIDYIADFSTTIDGWYLVGGEGLTVTITHDINRIRIDIVNNNPGVFYQFAMGRIISTTQYRYNGGTINATLRGSSANCEVSGWYVPGAFNILPLGETLENGYTLNDTGTARDEIRDDVLISFLNQSGSNETFYIESFTSSSTPYQLLNQSTPYQSVFDTGDTDGWSIALSGTATLSAAPNLLTLTYNSETSVEIQRALSYANDNIIQFTVTINANAGKLTNIYIRGLRANGTTYIRFVTGINYIFGPGATEYTTVIDDDTLVEFTRLDIVIEPEGETATEFSSISITALEECVEQQADLWTEAELINVKTGATEDISTYMNDNTEVSTQSNYQVAIYDSSVNLASNMNPGYYYLYLNDGQDSYYSEVFLACEDLSEFIKIEWWRDSDLVFTNQDGNARIVYSTGYINSMYIDSDIGKPQYQYQIEETERSGYKFVEKVVSFKRFNFDGILPEAIVDVISKIPHHEYITITYNGISLRVSKFDVREPDWTDYGDLAVLPIEFETYTVISSGTKLSGTVNELFGNDTEAINIRGNNKRIYQLNDTLDLDDLFIAADKDTLSEAVRLPFKETIQQIAIAEPVPKLDFDPQDEYPEHRIARIFYDAVENTWTLYTDIEGVSLQIGEELRARIVNNTGSTLLNGAAVSVTGASNNEIEIDLLDASNLNSSLRSYGLVTLEVVDGSVSYAVRYGAVRDVDTSTFTEGAILYADPENPGGLTESRPKAPFYPVRVGICLLKSATIGIIGVDTVIFNSTDTAVNIEGTLNGIVVDTPEVNFYESGGNIFVEVLNEKDNTRDLSFVLNGVRYNLNTTSGGGPNSGAFAQLTTGVDSETLFENYIYVWLNGSTPELKVSTLNTPDTLAEIGKASLFNYTRTISEGVYKFRRSNNAPDNGDDDGFNKWVTDAIRDKLGTTYTSGIDATVVVNSTPSVTISTTAGVAMQMHKSTFGLQDGTKYWIYNDNTNTVTYEQVSDLADIVETAAGFPLDRNGRYYRLRVYGMQNSSTGGGLSASDKLVITRPLGFYTSAAQAIVDANNYDVAINDIITEGVMFRLYTLVIARTGTAGNTWTLVEVQDNRTRLIGGVGGGGAQSGAGSDVNVAITSADTTPSYLNDKLTVSTSLTKTIVNPGANEQLNIDLASTITNVRQKFSGQVIPGFNTKTYSSSITFDFDDGNVQEVTITGDLTWSITNQQPGGSYTLYIIQDGTGGHTITGPSGKTSNSKEFSTGAGITNIVNVLITPGGTVLWSVVETTQ